MKSEYQTGEAIPFQVFFLGVYIIVIPLYDRNGVQYNQNGSHLNEITVVHCPTKTPEFGPNAGRSSGFTGLAGDIDPPLFEEKDLSSGWSLYLSFWGEQSGAIM